MLLALILALVLGLAHAPARSASNARCAHSASLGRPAHGSLACGVQLPAEGITFFTWDPVLHRSPDRGWRRWGTDRLVSTVEQVVTEYWLENPEAPRVGIGDLSRRYGGNFYPTHASHQNGRDVDVYYPRLDGKELAPVSVSQIDHALAQDLLDRFVAAGAVRIYVGPHTHLRGPRGIVQVLALHDNHMHVRIG